MTADPTGADAGWVLHRASTGLGPWAAWSASAHTLAVGSAFASSLVLLAGQLPFPAPLAQAVRPVLAAVAIGVFLPLGALALLHARRRVLQVAVDPAGLTLRTRRGEHRLDFQRLARVRTRAEPVFRKREPGRIGGFVASLQLVERGGRTWEFGAAHIDDLLHVLAWLQVLAPAEAVSLPPSALAARHRADDAARAAQLWLQAALAAASLCLVLQALRLARVAPGLAPGLFAASVLAVAVACALYACSFRAQVDAGRLWLMARGLNTGPPLPA